MNTIYIFRDGKTYYYKYAEEKHEIDYINLEKLINNVTLPFKIVFNNMSVAQRDKIISRFLSTGVTYQVTKIEGNKIEYVFSKIKHIVHAYKIPSKTCLEGRQEITKPYILRTIGEEKILIEVTKDYIRNSEEQFYFLYSELSEKERKFFEPVYTKIECDYIYTLSPSVSNINQLTRRKKNECNFFRR